ncbi:alpha-L-rhamnosidase C-terminal domain-containing protein [Streptomyces canus]|uniref:alpha-L-rhamnosidase C-terminal domain-containing protein n=1 Tax=Streptomyces canus TaxID=58343 RepID=UPI00386CF86B
MVPQWPCGHPPGARQGRLPRTGDDPRPFGGLTHVDGGYRTPCGVVSARWIRENGRFRLDVELPLNATAEVRIPTGGRTAQVTGDGAVFRGVRGNRATCSGASGRHASIARDTP